MYKACVTFSDGSNVTIEDNNYTSAEDFRNALEKECADEEVQSIDIESIKSNL